MLGRTEANSGSHGTLDYERPADANRGNTYNLSVRASDGRYYGYLEVTVAVTNLNEAPTIATISRTEFSQRENTTSILYTYRATDQDRSLDAIRWSVEGEDGDDFAIYSGMLTFRLLVGLCRAGGLEPGHPIPGYGGGR